MFARYFISLLPPLPPRRQLPVSERFYPEAVHCLALIPQVFISVLQIKFCSFFEIRFPKISLDPFRRADQPAGSTPPVNHDSLRRSNDLPPKFPHVKQTKIKKT